MVKVFFYFAFCLALVGCRSKCDYFVLSQDNLYLRYVNYDTTACGFPALPFEYYPAVFDFSLHVLEQRNKIPVTGDTSLLILKMTDDYHNKFYASDGKYIRNSMELDDIPDVFFCGKISIVDSISSFLILLESPFSYLGLSGNDVIKELYLFNYKNNRLTSIVETSIGTLLKPSLLGHYWHTTYYMHNRYFLQFQDSRHRSTRRFFPEQEVSDYLKIKEELEVVMFAAFTIDENGFVQFISF